MIRPELDDPVPTGGVVFLRLTGLQRARAWGPASGSRLTWLLSQPRAVRQITGKLRSYPPAVILMVRAGNGLLRQGRPRSLPAAGSARPDARRGCPMP